MSEQQLDQTLALLARTPSTLDVWLRDLPDRWTHRDERPDTWSAAGVVGHLVHTERTNWIPRLKTLLQFGESQPFAPFDRLGHEREIQERSLGALLEEFTRLLAAWAVHDLTHIHQISRVLAHQYRELVGPWSEYLSVLKSRQSVT